MMQLVTIQIEYYGWYAEKTGTKTEMFEVSSDLCEAYDNILKHFDQQYGLNPPFILLLGNKHIQTALKKQKPLTGGEIFKLLPFLSGG